MSSFIESVWYKGTVSAKFIFLQAYLLGASCAVATVILAISTTVQCHPFVYRVLHTTTVSYAGGKRSSEGTGGEGGLYVGVGCTEAMCLLTKKKTTYIYEIIKVTL